MNDTHVKTQQSSKTSSRRKLIKDTVTEAVLLVRWSNHRGGLTSEVV